MSGGQYGEDAILLDYFKGKKGFLVDVGAANGRDNSNSIRLLEQGWSGLLVEPDPDQYAELLGLWFHRIPDVIAKECACGSVEREETFWSCGQVSTLDPEWKARCELKHKVTYVPHRVQVKRLDNLLLDAFPRVNKINFLSIDCEGRDKDAIQSLSINIYQPDLICVESRAAGHWTEQFGYEFAFETRGNRFWRRK